MFKKFFIPLRSSTLNGSLSKRLTNPRLISTPIIITNLRNYSVDPKSMENMDVYESQIFNMLNEKFDPVQLEVADVSGKLLLLFIYSFIY